MSSLLPEIVPIVSLNWPHQYRVIPSRFPAINFFEKLVDPKQMEAAFFLESLTNDRLREEVGELAFIKPEDRICGKGSSVVMAAFTHIGKVSRFSDGSFGVYYASRDLVTALKETIYHRENFLSRTQEPPVEIEMRVYVGNILKPFHDIRDNVYQNLHQETDYSASQTVGKFLKSRDAYGVVYQSVRDKGGQCIAAFRPNSISIPKPSKHLVYVWNGKKIDSVYEKSQVLLKKKRVMSEEGVMSLHVT